MPGDFEILFGVSSADDPAVGEIERLRREFPECAIRLIVCPERLGTSGKVSSLVQMLGEAQYEFVLINDSDIRVSRNYLSRVMRGFSDTKVGMVTALYRGRTAIEGAALTLWSRLEALGIATDFMAGVLAARRLEGGIRFGLGSTLAMSRAALTRAGGLGPLVDSLADDYEMGARIAQAGYKRRAMRRGGGDSRAGVRAARILRAPTALGADPARRAALGLPGAGNHLLHPVGRAELHGQRVRPVELYVAEPGGVGACRRGADGRRRRAGRRTGAARHLADAPARLHWAGLLGVELCVGHGGVAGGTLPAEGRADFAGVIKAGSAGC